MKPCRSGTWLLIVLLGFPPTLQADVDVSEYQATGAVRSRQETERLQKEFEQQRALEEERARQAEAEAARQLAEEAARRAARPWPVRLTEARCTLCHSATNYETSSHTLPGWIAVILRMRYFNMAPLEWEETWIIGRHLSKARPPDASTALFEWGATGTLIAAPFLLYYWATRRHRRFRKKEP